MKCYYHHEKDAKKVCKMCHHAYCDECFYTFEDDICKTCVRKYSTITVRNLVKENNIHMKFAYRLFLVFLAGMLVGLIGFYEINQFYDLSYISKIYGFGLLLFLAIGIGGYLSSSLFAGREWLLGNKGLMASRAFQTPIVGDVVKVLIVVFAGIFVAIPYSLHRFFMYIRNKHMIESEVKNLEMV